VVVSHHVRVMSSFVDDIEHVPPAAAVETTAETSASTSSVTIDELEEMLIAVHGPIHGSDTLNNSYTSIKKLWKRELKGSNPKVDNKKKGSMGATASSSSMQSQWYSKAFSYWEDPNNCPVTDDGVLGGYGKLTPIDTQGSNMFLDHLASRFSDLQFNSAADCGAGIGRVAKHLLCPRFKAVNLIEQSPRLLTAAPAYIGDTGSCSVHCTVEGLQDFEPTANSYDVIWIQWVVGHLHDLDFIRFFKRCAAGLRPGGFVCLKDNVLRTAEHTFMVDRDDSSVARHDSYIKLLFTLSGLTIVHEIAQQGFPEELYPVVMFALAPVARAIMPQA
jgi:protein N-terminal methyltransferase